ncbi:MAG: B12-binding domain-containing radical SAM protein [Saprospiraceae bacterium]|nr:B12-binding domain-containing radical SAM protein [Saprospiraceae bacterium]
MKVLFIIKDIESAEPIGIMHISALLRKHGHLTAYSGTEGVDLVELISKFKPDIIGCGVCTGFQNYYLNLNRELKKKFNFISIFGGPHPTFFPDFILEENVDIICRGEGEYPMLDLCNRLKNGEDVTSIENLWVKQNGKIYKNNLRPLIKNLDELPWPDRETSYNLDSSFKEYGARSFISTRGCPFECSYCFNASYMELYGSEWKKCRIRSPQDLVNEIYAVKNDTNLKFVQFRCSIFPWDDEWLKEFSKLYKVKIKLPFYCHVRADLLNSENVKLMADAGCFSVNMGFECGDEDYRKKVFNRHITNEQIINASKLLHENGIRILSDNMVCLPGGNLDLDIKTFKLNVKCKVEYPLAMILQPYPGTGIEKYCVENGYFDGDYDKIFYNYYYKSPLDFESKLEKRKMENFQKLFAFATEIPWALDFVKFLVRFPSNIFFLSIFRLWYSWCYQYRIMPFKKTGKDRKETIEALLGIYKTDKYEN